MYGGVQHDLGRAPPALTPIPATEQERILAWATALPCGQMHPSWCLDPQWDVLVKLCRAGAAAPRGVTARTWAAFCAKVRSCGVISYPSCSPTCLSDAELRTAVTCLTESGGCADAGYVERIAGTTVCPDVFDRYQQETPPSCLPAEQADLVRYWDTYAHRGPDRRMNGVVFAASRVGLIERLRAVPPCAGVVPPSSGQRPPPVLPTPEQTYAYPVDEYQPDAPAFEELPAGPPPGDRDATRRKWMIAGVAGAVVLGGVFLVAKKKRGS